MIDLTKRKFSLGLAGGASAGLLLLVAPACADEKAPVEGTEYRTLKPAVPTSAGDKKIEVIEFFWYGCPHCNALEPLMEPWQAKLPPDVLFRKVHVPFREVKHQQLYFTLETMGKTADMNRKVFAAIHGQNNPLNNQSMMEKFVEENGLDPKQFGETFKSFDVATKMRKASALAESYKVDGVPAFGINGKYYTAPTMAGGNNKVLAVVDALIDAERRTLK